MHQHRTARAELIPAGLGRVILAAVSVRLTGPGARSNVGWHKSRNCHSLRKMLRCSAQSQVGGAAAAHSTKTRRNAMARTAQRASGAGETGKRWVYQFGTGVTDGNADMRNLLGGKGANLAEMSSLGLPVPPGFTITTEVCAAYYDGGRQAPGRPQAAGRGGAGRDRQGGRRHVRRRRRTRCSSRCARARAPRCRA